MTVATSEQLLTSLEQKASPEHAALIVVDVQNDFVADGGYFHQVGCDVSTIQKSAIPPLAASNRQGPGGGPPDRVRSGNL